MKQKFPQLLEKIKIKSSSDTKSVMVEEVVLSSKNTGKGKVFLALPGILSDGRNYLHDAVRNGAVAIIAEANELSDEQNIFLVNSNIPWVLIENVSQKLAQIAEIFYGDVTQDMQLVGITGTNGKTSVCQMVAEIIQKLSGQCGQMGTLGNGLVGALTETINTTSDPLTIRKILSVIAKAKAKYTIMEVSSHALEQKRVDMLKFKVAVFTNLSRDHLDYHKTMESYAAAKKKLFVEDNVEYAVINADDKFGLKLLADKQISAQKLAYSTDPKVLDSLDSSILKLSITDVEYKQTLQRCIISTPWGAATLNIPLIGEFNLSNTLAVVGILGSLGFEWKKITREIENLHPVPGRMEVFGGGQSPLVIVDYAHTPDALEKALIALREHCKNDLLCVFGSGGDRDMGKRPLMGAVAEKYSDKIIITDDNPRNENGNQIISGILSGLKHPSKAVIKRNRVEAIEAAFGMAKPGDTLLIAGKGHENFQYVGGCKLPHSDRNLVSSILQQVAS
jgi:UDP-N-acetylmuramoyl-L-alanyl-D-glutamate--2,6-diaminopimelate ligase